MQYFWRFLGFGAVGALMVWDIVRKPEGLAPIAGIFGADPLGIPTVVVAAVVLAGLLLPLIGMMWRLIDLTQAMNRTDRRRATGALSIAMKVWRNRANPEVRRLAVKVLQWLALFVVAIGIWIIATAAAGV